MPTGSRGGVHGVMPPHYLHELPAQDEERLAKIFNKLDLDGNGSIDVHDLSKALHEVGVHKSYAEKFLARSDRTKSGDISLAEFIHYVREHEKNLRLQFTDFDKNRDGKIDLEELIRAFKDLGIEMDRVEATKLLQRMDQDGSLNISFNEWRDFLLYAPSTNIHEIILYWRHSTYMDIGEDMGVPDDFTNSEMVSGMWWRHLVSGGIAGAVSRTCTAPLDRIKVYLQVLKTRLALRKTGEYSGVLDAAKKIYSQGGIKSFYRGYVPNLIGILPYAGIDLAVYETLKNNYLRTHEKNEQPAFWVLLLCGTASSTAGQVCSYPLALVRTRLQAQVTPSKGPTSMVGVFKDIIHREGFRGLYRGLTPNFLKVAPAVSISYVVYEHFRQALGVNMT
ncbi:calcium-binding mitochondrial carrier protein SCaMC-2 isoform X2 [Cephus cinctus]|uniref:Calcium-binding mitochondrial carrier protein SCaMC-2 isoform X2 n=1 Tax=Cephus cinctus TaxID=211228 RepID=A0AAJ7R959_CEPCN|nr:calcium-binding mitochondrial carrier protein SCaMC-2 isoform X2 [Cephus cinctus]